MSKVKLIDDHGLVFQCPACEQVHVIYYQGSTQRHKTMWNGDLNKPTIQPSIRFAWDTYQLMPNSHRQICIQYICHASINEGYITFLSDCTHPYVNQTIKLPDFAIRRR